MASIKIIVFSLILLYIFCNLINHATTYTKLTYTTTRVILKPEVIIIKAIDDRYYFMSEIMRYIGASRDSIPRWIATKDMSAHKVGKNWKFIISEIDEWINCGKTS